MLNLNKTVSKTLRLLFYLFIYECPIITYWSIITNTVAIVNPVTEVSVLLKTMKRQMENHLTYYVK